MYWYFHGQPKSQTYLLQTGIRDSKARDSKLFLGPLQFHEKIFKVSIVGASLGEEEGHFAGVILHKLGLLHKLPDEGLQPLPCKLEKFLCNKNTSLK